MAERYDLGPFVRVVGFSGWGVEKTIGPYRFIYAGTSTKVNNACSSGAKLFRETDELNNAPSQVWGNWLWSGEATTCAEVSSSGLAYTASGTMIIHSSSSNYLVSYDGGEWWMSAYGLREAGGYLLSDESHIGTGGSPVGLLMENGDPKTAIIEDITRTLYTDGLSSHLDGIPEKIILKDHPDYLGDMVYSLWRLDEIDEGGGSYGVVAKAGGGLAFGGTCKIAYALESTENGGPNLIPPGVCNDFSKWNFAYDGQYSPASSQGQISGPFISGDTPLDGSEGSIRFDFTVDLSLSGSNRRLVFITDPDKVRFSVPKETRLLSSFWVKVTGPCQQPFRISVDFGSWAEGVEPGETFTSQFQLRPWAYDYHDVGTWIKLVAIGANETGVDLTYGNIRVDIEFQSSGWLVPDSSMQVFVAGFEIRKIGGFVGTQLVQNGHFDAGIGQWDRNDAYGVTTHSWQTSNPSPQGGGYYQVGSGFGSITQISQIIQVEPGKTYKWEWYAKADVGASATLNIGTTFNGSDLGQGTATGGSWGYSWGTFNTSESFVHLVIDATLSGGTNVRFDGISVMANSLIADRPYLLNDPNFDHGISEWSIATVRGGVSFTHASGGGENGDAHFLKIRATAVDTDSKSEGWAFIEIPASAGIVYEISLWALRIRSEYGRAYLVTGSDRFRRDLNNKEINTSVSRDDFEISSAAGTVNASSFSLRDPGTISDTWTFTFTSATAFECIGAITGSVGTGTIGSTFWPINPENDRYFIVSSSFWTGTWANGDTLVVTTYKDKWQKFTANTTAIGGKLFIGVYLQGEAVGDWVGFTNVLIRPREPGAYLYFDRICLLCDSQGGTAWNSRLVGNYADISTAQTADQIMAMPIHMIAGDRAGNYLLVLRYGTAGQDDLLVYYNGSSFIEVAMPTPPLAGDRLRVGGLLEITCIKAGGANRWLVAAHIEAYWWENPADPDDSIYRAERLILFKAGDDFNWTVAYESPGADGDNEEEQVVKYPSTLTDKRQSMFGRFGQGIVATVQANRYQRQKVLLSEDDGTTWTLHPPPETLNGWSPSNPGSKWHIPLPDRTLDGSAFGTQSPSTDPFAFGHWDYGGTPTVVDDAGMTITWDGSTLLAVTPAGNSDWLLATAKIDLETFGQEIDWRRPFKFNFAYDVHYQGGEFIFLYDGDRLLGEIVGSSAPSRYYTGIASRATAGYVVLNDGLSSQFLTIRYLCRGSSSSFSIGSFSVQGHGKRLWGAQSLISQEVSTATDNETGLITITRTVTANFVGWANGVQNQEQHQWTAPVEVRYGGGPHGDWQEDYNYFLYLNSREMVYFGVKWTFSWDITWDDVMAIYNYEPVDLYDLFDMMAAGEIASAPGWPLPEGHSITFTYHFENANASEGPLPEPPDFSYITRSTNWLGFTSRWTIEELEENDLEAVGGTISGNATCVVTGDGVATDGPYSVAVDGEYFVATELKAAWEAFEAAHTQS